MTKAGGAGIGTYVSVPAITRWWTCLAILFIRQERRHQPV